MRKHHKRELGTLWERMLAWPCCRSQCKRVPGWHSDAVCRPTAFLGEATVLAILRKCWILPCSSRKSPMGWSTTSRGASAQLVDSMRTYWTRGIGSKTDGTTCIRSWSRSQKEKRTTSRARRMGTGFGAWWVRLRRCDPPTGVRLESLLRHLLIKLGRSSLAEHQRPVGQTLAGGAGSARTDDIRIAGRAFRAYNPIKQEVVLLTGTNARKQGDPAVEERPW